MRRGKFSISPELLREALKLPIEVRIVGLEWDFSAERGVVHLREGPNSNAELLPEVPEAGVTPFVVPVLGTDGVVGFE